MQMLYPNQWTNMQKFTQNTKKQHENTKVY